MDFLRTLNVSVLSNIDRIRPSTVLVGTLSAVILTLGFKDWYEWSRIHGHLARRPVWWIITSVIRVTTGLSDPTKTKKLRAHPDKTRFLAKDLPQRRGPRAQIYKWPVPHRHISQMLDPTFFERIEAHLAQRASQNNLLTAPSLREGGSGMAVYSQLVGGSDPDPKPKPSPKLIHDRLHSHPTDHSVHVALPPLDAAEVIEKGWGELFALSGMWIPAGTLDVATILVYAPRDEGELGVVLAIIDAGIKYNISKLEA